MIDRERARRAFADYVAPYDPHNPRISLKVAHTYRVAAMAERIARSLAMDPDDVDLAWACGLLHDIGRFEQVRRWDTFSDARSTSHARLGVEVLWGPRERLGAPVGPDDPGAATPRIRDFLPSPKDDALLRTAIALHSDFRLPQELDARTRTFAEILRDADKVDILRTVQADTPETIIGCTADELLASELSPAALTAFAARRCMRREEREHPADFLVALACFVFELVHPEARRATLEQGHAFELLERPFNIAEPFRDPSTRRELARMALELRSYLETSSKDAPQNTAREGRAAGETRETPTQGEAREPHGPSPSAPAPSDRKA